MTLIQSIILGIIQGITEFLPISSSAHLVLVPYFLNWDIPVEQVFPFDVLVQLGTLLAVIVYFFKDLIHIIKAFLAGLQDQKVRTTLDFRLGLYIIIGTLPAGVIGFLLDDLVEAAFNSPPLTGIFLLVTAGILFIAELLGKRNRSISHMRWQDALIIGFGQALAIFPGISRSGATISTGLLRNLDRKTAASFSFLLSIPIFIAAGLLSALDLFEMSNLSEFLPILLVGFITAAIFGYLSIHWLLKFLAKRSLKPFAIYCLILGIFTLLFAYVF